MNPMATRRNEFDWANRRPDDNTVLADELTDEQLVTLLEGWNPRRDNNRELLLAGVRNRWPQGRVPKEMV